jgi:hypothetical protein
MLGEISGEELPGSLGLGSTFLGEVDRHIGIAGILRPVDVGVALSVAY